VFTERYGLGLYIYFRLTLQCLRIITCNWLCATTEVLPSVPSIAIESLPAIADTNTAADTLNTAGFTTIG
jgi:hypothetical protein